MKHLKTYESYNNLLNENWYGADDKEYSVKLDMSKFLQDLDYTFGIIKELNPLLKTWRDEAFLNEKSEWGESCEIEFDKFDIDINHGGKVNSADNSLLAMNSCKIRLVKDEISEYMNFYYKYRSKRIPCKRVISVDNLEDINWDKIGKYWSFDNEHGTDFSNPNKQYRVEFFANVNSSSVDWLNSLDNYVFFGDAENEIKIKSGEHINIDYMEVRESNDQLQFGKISKIELFKEVIV